MAKTDRSHRNSTVSENINIDGNAVGKQRDPRTGGSAPAVKDRPNSTMSEYTTIDGKAVGEQRDPRPWRTPAEVPGGRRPPE